MSKEECVGRVVPIFAHAIGRIEGENARAAARGVKDDVPVGRKARCRSIVREKAAR